jgi:uncharacterized RDD family membrane protein YckC
MSTRVEQTGAVGARRGAGRGVAPVAARARAHRAPFSLRCGALLIDYTAVVAIVAFATVMARVIGEGGRATSDLTLLVGYVAAAAVAALNFLVLPVFTGRTLGKWATGLRVERTGGEPLDFARALLRHTAGYLLSVLTLGVGFLAAAFSREGRALHDLIAGTVVVRD